MSGSNQSVNLQGMLGDLAGTVGEMGKAYDFIPNAIREINRPEVNMDDPESMQAYGSYLIRNGREAEGRAMLASAAELTRENRARNGEAAIAAMAAKLRKDMPASERQKIMEAIAAVSGQTGLRAIDVNSVYENQRLARGELAVKEQDAETNSRAVDNNFALGKEELALKNKQIQNDYDIANKNYSVAVDTLAEKIRSNLAGEGLTGRDLTRKENELAESVKQFGMTLDLDTQRFKESQRFNDARIFGIESDVAQGWKGLDQEDQRIEISKALSEEKITMGQFERLIMGDENRRAEDMHPVNKALKEAQIKVATATAGYSEAQTADLLYDLGFKRDTEDLRVDALELDNKLANANVLYRRAQTDYTKENTDLVAEQVKTERERTDHVSALTKSITASIERDDARLEMDQAFNQFTMDFKERQQGWDMGMDELKVQLEQQRIESGIQFNQAQIANIDNTIRSSVFRDELAVADLLSNQVSDTAKLAYSAGINVLDANQVANARAMFVQQHGPQAAYDFDQAMARRIELKKLELDTSAMALNLENKQPVTRERLVASGMPEQRIDQVLATNDPTTRNNMIQAWAKDANTPERGGGLMTEESVSFYEDIAKDIQQAFCGQG